MADLTLKCIERDCGKDFVITEKEQAWYASRTPVALSLPKRCKECRQKRRAQQATAPVVAEPVRPVFTKPLDMGYIPPLPIDGGKPSRRSDNRKKNKTRRNYDD